MLIRSYSSVMVVSSAATRTHPAACRACNAIALSLPPLQQKSTSSGSGISLARASLMARCVLHTDAKLAPERRKPIHFRVLLVGEIVDAAVDAKSMRNVISRRKIQNRVTRDHNLPWKVIVQALPAEISGKIPVHAQQARIERHASGIDRASQQAAALKIVRVLIAGRGERARRVVRVVRAGAQPTRDARLA